MDTVFSIVLCSVKSPWLVGSSGFSPFYAISLGLVLLSCYMELTMSKLMIQWNLLHIPDIGFLVPDLCSNTDIYSYLHQLGEFILSYVIV